MHILIIADAIDTQNAGIHFYTKNLIENLLKIDSENRYSFIHSRSHGFFKNLDAHILEKRPGLGSETIRRFIRMPKLIKKINPDIVLEPCHIGPFRIPNHIKRAVTIHDITPITMPHLHTARGRIVHKLLLARSLKNANLILTPSETTKQDILDRYKITAPINVTHLGLTPHQESLNPSPLDKPYILYLGTLEPRKNLELLVDAFLELDIPHKLVLAGGIGWKSKSLLEKITPHKDKIILPGYLTEGQKNTWLTHADMFVYPSLYEGFGIPIIEAMQHEIPVICSTGGSLKELFSNYALTFDPSNKETLKGHIKTLATSPGLRTQLSQKSQAYAQNFTWEKTAKETLAALTKTTCPMNFTPL